ncbi:MAG: tetratricopeptide repeat protein [Acidobacteria bacterium]|nr:tetratricopeptide repeat protein [Acidobacteriota bacterium]
MNAQPGVEYVGDEACRTCHPDQYESFKKTGMGRSMSVPKPGGDGKEFAGPSAVRAERLSRVFESFARDGKVFHTGSQVDATGKKIFSETHELAYAVGSGDHGRSYLIVQGDSLFLSPLSFYTATGRWDLSPGVGTGVYRDFTRPATEVCVTCHSGLPQPVAGFANRYRQPAFRFLAIGCERCHGPGQLHAERPLEGRREADGFNPSIVNPAKLPPRQRDDVCIQCHLLGDARVLKPGRQNLDFRPGRMLDDVVSVFSVPPAQKGESFLTLGHVAQLQLSRCRTSGGERLACITCHDPHSQPRGDESVRLHRNRCLQCHTKQGCTLPAPERQATSPADNCLSCHMPARSLAHIAHTALTDHRIPRRPSEDRSLSSLPEPATGLIWETQPPGAREPDARTLAIAYAQLGQALPRFGIRGLPILDRAAQEFPDDLEIQATYGLVVPLARPSAEGLRQARQALERAIALGSKSVFVRLHLAQMLLEARDRSAFRLFDEAIQLDPFYAPARLGLAWAYLQAGDREKAIATIQEVLTFDPGNPDARAALDQLRRSP